MISAQRQVIQHLPILPHSHTYHSCIGARSDEPCVSEESHNLAAGLRLAFPHCFEAEPVQVEEDLGLALGEDQLAWPGAQGCGLEEKKGEAEVGD